MNQILSTMNTRIGSILVFLIFVACGGQKQDIHTMDRQTKAYESALVESMGQGELMQHLKALADEMSLATESETYVEMHHIEIALTKALDALKSKAPPSAQSTLDTLKVVAAKIHGAGHDQNKSMAGILNKTLEDQIKKLQEILPVAE